MDALASARVLLPLAGLLVVLDTPWLYASQRWVATTVQKVQGGAPLRFRWPAAAVVYLALAYLLTVAQSMRQAVYMGIATYAVFDFTNYAIFTNYDLQFAVADTLWGGLLFGAARWVATRFALL